MFRDFGFLVFFLLFEVFVNFRLCTSLDVEARYLNISII